MEKKENIMFSDKEIVPTDDLIFRIIGKNKDMWQSIMKYMQDHYEDSGGEWNYYNDGKRWLFKMVRKKKTIFWISVLENTFRVTFWFPDRAEPVIEESDLPGSIKDEFRNAKKYGATRGITIEMSDTGDVDNVKKLIGIKVKMK